MQKFLLRTVSVLAIAVAGTGAAHAQLTTFTENPNAPLAPPPTRSSAAYAAASGFGYNVPPIPAPGTAIVRIAGLIREYFGVAGGLSQVNTTGSGHVGGSKLGNPDIFGWIRLYPSLEGVAANGLKYGAFAEIRQDTNAGAGGGAYGSISSTSVTRGQLYWRRAYLYFGTDDLGIIRLGSQDGATSLYITGTVENFDDGGWNPPTLQSIIPANLSVTWPFTDQGNEYTTEKAEYLSPALFGSGPGTGFDFGISYEPTTGSVNGSGTNCGAPNFSNFTLPTTGANAGAGCDQLSSTGTGDISRRRNTFEGVLRYRNAFGPVGATITAGFIESSRVRDSDTLPLPSGRFGYNGLNVGDFGAQFTYAGFSLQGHLDYGTFNPSAGWATLPPAGAPTGLAWITGGTYTIGPVVVGASYFRSTGAGNQTPLNVGTVGKLTEQGIAAGATYTVVPGFGFYLDYLYGLRKENGYDLIDKVSGSSLHNATHVQAAALTAWVKW